MTATRRWLETRRTELARITLRGVAAAALGAALVLAGLGVVAGRWGLYRYAPDAALLGWALIAGVLVLCAILARRRMRQLAFDRLARTIEQASGVRDGAIAGAADLSVARGSAALVAHADRRALDWLDQHGRRALAGRRAAETRLARRGLMLAAAGAVVFAASRPASPAGAVFFRPVALALRARSAVSLTVDHHAVLRGRVVQATLLAPGRAAAMLYTRAPGEPWRASTVTLDDSGHAVVPIGPLESDRYLYAVSGGRRSDTVRVTVSLPAFLSELSLVAHYPGYIGRGDEPLAPGPDTVVLPVGTRVRVTGRATVGVASAVWQSAGGRSALVADSNAFHGDLVIGASGAWRLVVTPRGATSLDDQAPELHVTALADSAPVVSVPVPGHDTVVAPSLLEPLVIDARDDYLVTRVEVASRRASRLVGRGAPLVQPLALPEGGVPRAVLQWVLDLNGRGFQPGDTAFFLVRATDNAPRPHTTETREFAVRLPSLAELREAVRQRSSALGGSVDSLARAQRELSQRTQDLAQERERAQDAGASHPPDSENATQLPFRSAERAQDLADQQRRVLDRAGQLRQSLEDLRRSAERAGLADSSFRRQLGELEDLLRHAVTPELAQRLEELRQALQHLDAQATQEALRQLAQAQQQLKDALERSHDLFERAAIEGALSTLSQDAQELAQQQREWTDSAAHRADSTTAAAERDMSRAADTLAARLDSLAKTMRANGAPPDGARDAGKAARQAAGDMRQAAQSAAQRDPQGAQQSGEQASQSLQPVAQQLRQTRDSLQTAWRQEVVAALDRALAETAGLAEREQQVADRLRRGETGAAVRGDQAALRDGADRILQRLQSAAGKNALVSPQLSQALGYAKQQMTGALGELEQGQQANGRQAGEAAGQAVDGLNAVAYALLRSRSDVAGSQSGSGFAEAVEKMAQLAQQQRGLNGQAGGLLPMMGTGGDIVMQQLRALAQQQRALADELDRLRQSSAAAGPLADEARELARRLEAGLLDQPTVQRQEQLFRHMLDAGRTLHGEEPDQQRERQSVTAKDDSVHVPPALKPGVDQPRYPYPTWDELRQLTPEERRLILDYFRRLNEAHH